MECFWYLVLTHLAGLFLGMYLQEKITKYSILNKLAETQKKKNTCSDDPFPMSEPKNTNDF